MFEEWISRCEETIKSFLVSTKIDATVVQRLLDDEQTQQWREIMKTRKNEAGLERTEKKKPVTENPAGQKNRERKQKIEKRMTGLIMGKLHEDMMFLDKIANHPALQNNLLAKESDKNDKIGADIALKGIQGAAKDGLSFLQVRKCFWETSEPLMVNTKNRLSLSKCQFEKRTVKKIN